MDIFQSFLRKFQAQVIESFLNLQKKHRSFLIMSPSRYLNSRFASHLAESLWGLESHSIPADWLIVRKERANNISVEDARKIREFIQFKPLTGKGKIVIIEDADTLSIEAQNALLKPIEEPPPGVNFLLCARNRDNLLPTINSRVSLIRPVLPQKNKAAEFLSDFLDSKEVALLQEWFLVDPVELFALDPGTQASSLSERGAELIRSGKIHGLYDLLTKEEYSGWLSDHLEARVGMFHLSFYSAVFFLSIYMLQAIPDRLHGFQLISRSIDQIEEANASYLKQKESGKEELEAVMKDFVYPLFLLQLSEFIKKKDKSANPVCALSKIEQWFVNKNLKFLPFYEDLLLMI
ncbi:MAG: hypothetical protein PHW04_16275 [Candidatus Wallbacteria bacterium]|nr:hypothetical protein [Candidatus Wallbacteria bacterium]